MTPASAAAYDVADLTLAPAGARRVDFAERSMPVLRRLREQVQRTRPLAGVRVAACMHLTPETGVLARAVLEAGGELHLAASNPLSTQDDVAAALVAEGVAVHARHGAGRQTYDQHLAAVLQARPHLLLDDGCDLVLLLQRRPELREGVRAGAEETSTGVLRLRQMAADGALWLPVVAVDETPTQLLVTEHGTGQSTLDAVVRATGTLLAGSTVVVAGYGGVGRGIAERARGLGASVVVTEVDAGRALAALLDGHRVLPVAQAAPLADVLLTATGSRDVVTPAHVRTMREGAVLANAGHFDVEIDVAGLRAEAVRVERVRRAVEQVELPGGPRVLLLADGRPVNLSAADGHPPAVMDVSFAVHLLVLAHLAAAELAPGVHPVPAALDDEVARTALAVRGVELDAVTAEQAAYLSTWRPSP